MISDYSLNHPISLAVRSVSFGLLAVRLLYRFYARIHLSKWFTFSLFKSVVFFLRCRLYACTQLPYFFRFTNKYQSPSSGK